MESPRESADYLAGKPEEECTSTNKVEPASKTGHSRSSRTLSIEARLKEGKSVSSIAREFGVSRIRVQQIRRRLFADYELATAINKRLLGEGEVSSATPAAPAPSMRTLTIRLTQPVHDALVEACAITNRRSPDESITVVEYVEELVITQVVEMGLLRGNKRR